jgi:hypothetical protein
MIYNLFEFLKAQFPAYVFIVDGWENDDPVESNLIKQTGGDVAHWYDRQDFTVQFMSRSKSKVQAKQRADAVFTFLRNRFGCILPETTVESVFYPALTAAQISPLQNPGYIGSDQNRDHMYSVNFQITVGG